MVWPGRYRGERGQQRDKPYREALRMELAAAGDNMKELREIAKAHIAKCKEGDLQAIKELADRLDGKATQMLVTEGTQDVTIRRPLTYQIVHVTKTQEQIESDNDGLLIEHKPVDGNGHDDSPINGNGHDDGNGGCMSEQAERASKRPL